MHSPSSSHHDPELMSQRDDDVPDCNKNVDDLADHVSEIELQHEQHSRPPSVPQSPVRSSHAMQSPRNGHHTSPTKSPPAMSQSNGVHNNGYSPRNPKMPLSKMHTGLKNISSNVFAAVSPSQKMEFDQEKNEGFGSVKINRPIRNPRDKHETDSVMSHDSQNSRLTEQGHFDLKYYHNRLW